jgi:hypothetical protein
VKRLAPLLAGVALVASACGGTAAQNELKKTGDNLGKIRSGTISFSLLVTPRTKLAHNPFGFRLHGPFAFGDRPTARVAYTQIADGKSATVTLVLEHGGGYALVDGKRRAFNASQLRELRGAASAGRAGAKVQVGDWLRDPRSCGSGCVEGTLDTAAAVKGLLELEYGAGENASTPRLTDAESKQLADATRRATYRVRSTKDHLLRDLRLHVDLGFDVQPKLRRALGTLVGARIDLRLALANPKT